MPSKSCSDGGRRSAPAPDSARRRASLWRALGACLCWASPVVWAQAQAPAVARPVVSAATADSELRQILQAFERIFHLSDALPLRDDLKQSARAIAQEHLIRLRSHVATWLVQAQAAAPDRPLDPGQRVSALYYRFSNELTAWRLAAGEPDSGTVTSLAEFVPLSACRHADMDGLWAMLMLQLQALPPDRQASALAAEAALLQRWGQWPEPPAPVEPSLADLTQALLTNLDQAPASLAPPMLPALASVLMRDPIPRARSVSRHCADHLWRLQAALAHGRPRAQALAAYAQAAAPRPGDRSEGLTADSDGYPALARRYLVEGKVTVALTTDARGRVLGARVLRRQLQAMDQKGSRPLAYELLLDAASLEQAMQMPAKVPPPAELVNGVHRRDVEFVWKLE